MPLNVLLPTAETLGKFTALSVLAPLVAVPVGVTDKPLTVTVPDAAALVKVRFSRLAPVVLREVSASVSTLPLAVVCVTEVVPYPVSEVVPLVPVRLSAPVESVNPLLAVNVLATDSVPVNAAVALMVWPLMAPEVPIVVTPESAPAAERLRPLPLMAKPVEMLVTALLLALMLVAPFTVSEPSVPTPVMLE